MNRLLHAALAMVPLAFVSHAVAGDYHSGTNLRCDECHVMHFSQSHGYNPDGTGFIIPLGAGGPFHYLLRDEVNNLCLNCHDGSAFAPDVFGPTDSAGQPNGRLGGYLNREGVSTFTAVGHTLDSTATAPGSDPPWNNPDGLNCVDCHHQHGYAGPGAHANGNYRNLRHAPGNGNYGITQVTYAISTNDLTLDVFERNGAAQYDFYDTDWNEPDPTESKIGQWCGQCHDNFHGTVGSVNIGGTTTDGEFVRHPSAGVDIGAIGGGHSSLTVFQSYPITNRVKVMSSTGDWEFGTDVTPTCISCHKGHGNGNAFGLIYMKGSGPVGDDGDDGTEVYNLCGQCHVQADVFNE